MPSHKKGLKGRTVKKDHFSSGYSDKETDEQTRIVVTFLDGKNLLATDVESGKSDPVGFVWCGYGDQSLDWDTYKDETSNILLTQVCSHTCDPIWNEEVNIPIEIPTIDGINDITCRIAIRDEDTDDKNEIIYEDLGQIKVPLLTVIKYGKALKNSYVLPSTKYVLEKCVGMRKIDGHIRLKIAVIFSSDDLGKLLSQLCIKQEWDETHQPEEFTKLFQQTLVDPPQSQPLKSRTVSPMPTYKPSSSLSSKVYDDTASVNTTTNTANNNINMNVTYPNSRGGTPSKSTHNSRNNTPARLSKPVSAPNTLKIKAHEYEVLATSRSHGDDEEEEEINDGHKRENQPPPQPQRQSIRQRIQRQSSTHPSDDHSQISDDQLTNMHFYQSGSPSNSQIPSNINTTTTLDFSKYGRNTLSSVLEQSGEGEGDEGENDWEDPLEESSSKELESIHTAKQAFETHLNRIKQRIDAMENEEDIDIFAIKKTPNQPPLITSNMNNNNSNSSNTSSDDHQVMDEAAIRHQILIEQKQDRKMNQLLQQCGSNEDLLLQSPPPPAYSNSNSSMMMNYGDVVSNSNNMNNGTPNTNNIKKNMITIAPLEVSGLMDTTPHQSTNTNTYTDGNHGNENEEDEEMIIIPKSSSEQSTQMNNVNNTINNSSHSNIMTPSTIQENQLTISDLYVSTENSSNAIPSLQPPSHRYITPPRAQVPSQIITTTTTTTPNNAVNGGGVLMNMQSPSQQLNTPMQSYSQSGWIPPTPGGRSVASAAGNNTATVRALRELLWQKDKIREILHDLTNVTTQGFVTLDSRLKALEDYIQETYSNIQIHMNNPDLQQPSLQQASVTSSLPSNSSSQGKEEEKQDNRDRDRRQQRKQQGGREHNRRKQSSESLNSDNSDINVSKSGTMRKNGVTDKTRKVHPESKLSQSMKIKGSATQTPGNKEARPLSKTMSFLPRLKTNATTGTKDKNKNDIKKKPLSNDYNDDYYDESLKKEYTAINSEEDDDDDEDNKNDENKEGIMNEESELHDVHDNVSTQQKRRIQRRLSALKAFKQQQKAVVKQQRQQMSENNTVDHKDNPNNNNNNNNKKDPSQKQQDEVVEDEQFQIEIITRESRKAKQQEAMQNSLMTMMHQLSSSGLMTSPLPRNNSSGLKSGGHDNDNDNDHNIMNEEEEDGDRLLYDEWKEEKVYDDDGQGGGDIYEETQQPPPLYSTYDPTTLQKYQTTQKQISGISTRTRNKDQMKNTVNTDQLKMIVNIAIKLIDKYEYELGCQTYLQYISSYVPINEDSKYNENTEIYLEKSLLDVIYTHMQGLMNKLLTYSVSSPEISEKNCFSLNVLSKQTIQQLYRIITLMIVDEEQYLSTCLQWLHLLSRKTDSPKPQSADINTTPRQLSSTPSNIQNISSYCLFLTEQQMNKLIAQLNIVLTYKNIPTKLSTFTVLVRNVLIKRYYT